MRDDPRKNLKWLEQQLLQEEAPQRVTTQTEDLLARADAALGLDPEESPLGNFSRKSRGAKAEQAHVRHQFDESAAVVPKTKKQLRKEAKQATAAEKKAAVNHKLKDLVFLAVLEIIGILCILGWWLQ